MNTQTENSPEVKEDWKIKRDERRKILIEHSEWARDYRDKEGLDCTLNQIIIDEIYTDESNEEFHSFWKWKELGYKVKKGMEAFAVWGKKRTVETQTEDEDEESKKYKYFPLAYLFSNAQVEPLKEAAGV